MKTDEDNNEFKYYPLETNKMKEYLSYIYEWNGLTSSAKMPSTYKEYENKARNWLNGRRTKQYSDTLFVDMISSSLNVKFYIKIQYVFENITNCIKPHWATTTAPKYKTYCLFDSI